MLQKIASIDIHKKVLMVVVATTFRKSEEEIDEAAGTEEAIEYECRRFGTGNGERMNLVSWLGERKVTEVVMESTAQYWKPIWMDLEPHFPKLHLAQAYSNRAPRGRKNDFNDAKRLARRLLASELMLSFVPDGEQRLWRTLTRSKLQLTRERVRLQSQMEALLEEARIKLTSVISDLFGASGRRILEALARGEKDPVKLAELGDDRLKCTTQELEDALTGHVDPVQQGVLAMNMERLAMYDNHIARTDGLVAVALKKHQDAVIRIAEIPGFGVDSAQQLIAEIGVDAKTFKSAGNFCSWVGVCPGQQESAEKNTSSRSAKGNRYVRRILTQAAQAAVKKKRSFFQSLFHRLLPRLGWKAAIWAIAHRLGCLVWKILHDGVRYIEKGEETTPQAKKRRLQKLKQALRKLVYEATLTPVQATAETAQTAKTPKNAKTAKGAQTAQTV